ncbi:putative RNA 2'-phosphotransferase [Solirubrobacter pauli]|uniref:Probable RNA 2'-phosphotransferase n=1 Tax=Solirubrobacter pauli TaxID=166793 RepID=A0A660LG87_9ACTN|nr:RNA 2'-phosphotransferase [Solirubrobacter pauli]RKQ92930.1 putative RNA 2'-phosphotransferase [Solirubrobacter pauli]
MDDRRRVKVSKYLSKHLRHDPERLGLTLAPGGWVGVDELLRACGAHRFAVTRAELDEVVAKSEKQRFAFDETGERIRANQGHSVAVDLQLEPTAPPEQLYHGTGAGSVDSILATGLERRGRHHVHLSADAETARRVGMRHGRPVVLSVAAGEMARAGHAFFVSTNGVWLVDAVPPAFLRRA